MLRKKTRKVTLVTLRGKLNNPLFETGKIVSPAKPADSIEKSRKKEKNPRKQDLP